MRRLATAAFRATFLRHPARSAVASFAAAALLGMFVLSLPISSRDRAWTGLVDCLFTSTSAVCVTGLLVKSTPHHWSLFGQLVILTLIQMGGLGIMTMGAFVAIALRRRLSMRFESFMTDIVDSSPRESIGPLIRFICLFALSVEVAGVVALYLAWRGSMSGAGTCFYQSVFHSISAFCNAGFSLNNESLRAYAGRISVNLIMCALIVTGGIGFVVVRELKHYLGWWALKRRGKRPRLSVHSRLALLVTGVLLLVGFAVFICVEPTASQRGVGSGTVLLRAMFQSVTARTAGFNTVDLGAVAPATVFMLMALMYIGGSPGSTAGGIKTTTLGVMIASIMATLKGRNKAEMFNHSIPEETVHRVASIILLSVVTLVGGVFILLITESGRRGVTFGQIAFDAVSAFGTVGLSRGLTGPDCAMTSLGKLVITALMFVGRLGPIALILSVASLQDRRPYTYPEEHVLVG